LVNWSSFVRALLGCWLRHRVLPDYRLRIAGFQLRFDDFPSIMMISPGFVGKVVRNKNGFSSVWRSLLLESTILVTS
jgi:hypothetical protein